MIYCCTLYAPSRTPQRERARAWARRRVANVHVKYNVRDICMILYNLGNLWSQSDICGSLNIFYAIAKLIDNIYQVTETCLEEWWTSPDVESIVYMSMLRPILSHALSGRLGDVHHFTKNIRDKIVAVWKYFDLLICKSPERNTEREDWR